MNDALRYALGGLLILAGIAVYLIPTFIAIRRQHPQRTPIILLNIIGGLTFIGWVAALVWSVTNFRADMSGVRRG